MDKNENDELPKLSLEEENAFKRLKLNIEYGADLSKNSYGDMTPEIEAQFLDSVLKFEHAFENRKQISVFDKLGKPDFKPSKYMSDEEISSELDRILDLMHENGMALGVLADYDDEERLIYDFITQELFTTEIDDLNVPGMTDHFIYEEFHPNQKYNLEGETEDFIRIFFNTKSGFYENYHSTDALNHQELNNFRSLFKKFKMKFFNIVSVEFDDRNAKVQFEIIFWAKLKGTNKKVFFSGIGSIHFDYAFEFWNVRELNLPIGN